LQKEILERLPSNQSLYVEGAFTIWLRKACVNYFVLRGKPRAYAPHMTMDEKDGKYHPLIKYNLKKFLKG